MGFFEGGKDEGEESLKEEGKSKEKKQALQFLRSFWESRETHYFLP